MARGRARADELDQLIETAAFCCGMRATAGVCATCLRADAYKCTVYANAVSKAGTYL